MFRAVWAALFVCLISCATTSSQLDGTFDRAELRAIDARIEQAIAEHQIPGGVLWIERNGVAYGNRALVPAVEKNSKDTIYDAASITKVTATAPSIWLLIQQGKITLDAPVKTYIPEFTGGWRDEITIRHLLTHTSGLRPDLTLTDKWSGFDEAWKRILSEEIQQRPGSIFRYSDINYELLGEVVHRVSGEPLDQFARNTSSSRWGCWTRGSTRVIPSGARDPEGRVVRRPVARIPRSRSE